MATAAKKTEVAVAATQSVLAFSQETPDYMNQGAARGSEGVRSSDMLLPRLELVQALSPIKETNPDIKEGNLFNSVTGEVYGDMTYFVPVFFKMEFLVWRAQDQGGGFLGSFPTRAEADERRMQAISDGENPEYIEIVDTPVQYGMRITPDGHHEQIVISMAKTKAKVSRKWNAIIQIAGGDRFSRVYKVSSFKDENKKGQKFYNFVVQPAGFTPKAIYNEAERLYQMFKTEDVRVAHDMIDPSDSDRGEV